MKNMKKLVALFAATVMTMSLSVSAFAATVETTVGADDANIADKAFNLVFTAPEGGEADVDQLTMIAYLVPDTTTLEAWVPYDGTQTIVAINQVGGDVGFGSVPVDVAKLAVGNSIAVAIGGSDVGTTAKYLVTYTTAPQIVAYTVVYELADGTAEGNPTASNSDETIADFFAKVTTMPTKEGFTFKHWSKAVDGEAINTASTDKMSTLLDAGSTTTVTLYAVYETAAVPTIEILIGDVNLDGTVNTDDTAYLKKYLAIPARETAANNAKREQLKSELAALGYHIKAKEARTVNEK